MTSACFPLEPEKQVQLKAAEAGQASRVTPGSDRLSWFGGSDRFSKPAPPSPSRPGCLGKLPARFAGRVRLRERLKRTGGSQRRPQPEPKGTKKEQEESGQPLGWTGQPSGREPGGWFHPRGWGRCTAETLPEGSGSLCLCPILRTMALAGRREGGLKGNGAYGRKGKRPGNSKPLEHVPISGLK